MAFEITANSTQFSIHIKFLINFQLYSYYTMGLSLETNTGPVHASCMYLRNPSNSANIHMVQRPQNNINMGLQACPSKQVQTHPHTGRCHTKVYAWRVISSTMWRRASCYKFTNVSEERNASIIRVEQ
jgi:hypothetical protein